jgi:hypothetical protein
MNYFSLSGVLLRAGQKELAFEILAKLRFSPAPWRFVEYGCYQSIGSARLESDAAGVPGQFRNDFARGEC